MLKPNTDLQNNPSYYDITGTKIFPLHQSSYLIKSSVEHMGEIGKKGTHSNSLYKVCCYVFFVLGTLCWGERFCESFLDCGGVLKKWI